MFTCKNVYEKICHDRVWHVRCALHNFWINRKNAKVDHTFICGFVALPRRTVALWAG
jgi:hypothetical protein